MTQRASVKKGSMTYVWIVLAVIVVVAGYYMYGRGDSNAGKAMQPMLPPGDLAGAAPAFTLADLDGKPVSLSDFRGKDRRAELLGDLVSSLPEGDSGFHRSAKRVRVAGCTDRWHRPG